MFQKLLLWVDERPESAAAANQALLLARLGDARVFAVSVLEVPAAAEPSGAASAAKRLRRGPRRKATPTAEPEERAWSRLYEIEDDAFEANVKISLLLETGNRDEKLLALIDSYQLDALIIGTRSIRGWEELIERCPVTVLLSR